MESWTLALKLCCFPANDERCEIIAGVLSDNGIHSIVRFVRAPPFRNLVRAEALLDSEHTALLELARMLRIQRGRKECEITTFVRKLVAYLGRGACVHQ